MLKALSKAIELLGGQSQAARTLEVSQPTVWYWLRHMKKAPPEKVIQIERATGGKVTREQLRPDLYPPPDPLPMGSTAAVVEHVQTSVAGAGERIKLQPITNVAKGRAL